MDLVGMVWFSCGEMIENLVKVMSISMSTTFVQPKALLIKSLISKGLQKLFREPCPMWTRLIPMDGLIIQQDGRRYVSTGATERSNSNLDSAQMPSQ